MRQYDTVLIGHITLNEIQEVDGTNYPFYGGAALFGAYAVQAMGNEIGLITKMTKDQEKIQDLLAVPKENIVFYESKKNTELINTYITKSMERREITVKSVADPFKISDIPQEIESKIFHLGGAMYGDFEDGMIEALSKRGKVAVDLQAYIRHFNKEKGVLEFADYEHKMRDLPFIHFIKADAVEAEVLTGENDLSKAARKMNEWGVKEVLITHDTDILVFDGEKEYKMPIRSTGLSGRTGRGDTAFAIYTSQRLEKGPEEALLWATAAVSLKIEQPEPFKQKKKDVENYIKKQYPDYQRLFKKK